MLLGSRSVDPADFEARTGWRIEERGACRGDVCVPLPATARRSDGRLDVDVVADRLGMPVVFDDDHGIGALGPATVPTGHALATAEAPEVVLPDRHGKTFRLSALRGTKVLLLAWASW